jgi:hypothetical protein
MEIGMRLKACKNKDFVLILQGLDPELNRLTALNIFYQEDGKEKRRRAQVF